MLTSEREVCLNKRKWIGAEMGRIRGWLDWHVERSASGGGRSFGLAAAIFAAVSRPQPEGPYVSEADCHRLLQDLLCEDRELARRIRCLDAEPAAAPVGMGSLHLMTGSPAP